MSTVTTMTLEGEALGLADQFVKIRARAENIAAPLDEARFNWKPAPNRWSVAQCMGHLIIIGTESLPVIDRLIEECRQRGLRSAGPFRYGILGNVFVRVQEPPYRMRARTFRRLVPEETLPRDATLLTFVALQEKLAERARYANGLDLAAVRAPNAAHVPLALGQWFSFLAAHERRHLWQAEQVLVRPEFPPSPRR